MTEMGVPLPGSAGDSIANAVDPDEVYEIDKVLRATKVGGKYLIWVKWTGHADPTPVPRAQLLLDSNNPALLREIDEAVERYKEEKRLDEDDEDEPERQQSAEPVNDLVELKSVTFSFHHPFFSPGWWAGCMRHLPWCPNYLYKVTHTSTGATFTVPNPLPGRCSETKSNVRDNKLGPSWTQIMIVGVLGPHNSTTVTWYKRLGA